MAVNGHDIKAEWGMKFFFAIILFFISNFALANPPQWIKMQPGLFMRPPIVDNHRIYASIIKNLNNDIPVTFGIYYGNSPTCTSSYDQHFDDLGAYYVNDKFVKMEGQCFKNNLMITPKTDAGNEYLLNIVKSGNDLLIKIDQSFEVFKTNGGDEVLSELNAQSTAI